MLTAGWFSFEQCTDNESVTLMFNNWLSVWIVNPSPSFHRRKEDSDYFYAIHCIQLYTVILGPFDIKIFLGGLKDTKRHHDMKKYFCMPPLKWKKYFFLPSSKHDSGGKFKVNL